MERLREMKIIVAGSRNIRDIAEVNQAIADAPFKITELVHGGCSGVDELAAIWAEAHNVPSTVFRADWDVFGKAAGPIRNRDMARYADALIAVWDGKSRGTRNM